MPQIDNTRLRLIRQGEPGDGPVVCWISRDQRLADNWTLLHAAALARDARVPLVAVFCLADSFLDAGLRQFTFLLGGLRELEAACLDAGIGFVLLRGEPGRQVAEFVSGNRATALVHDFDPLRIKRLWQAGAAAGVSCPVWEADSHNIVPCREASGKQEFSAATFRRKITPLLEHYLTLFPALEPPKQRWSEQPDPVDWERIAREHPSDSSVPPVDWIVSR